MKKITDPQKRFAFGQNWSRFLKHLTEERIQEAEKSLQEKLGVSDLSGKTFLDAGSGSGLFSLAAHRLGARVFSFDYDADSVNCTRYLKEHYGTKSESWSVEQGSVLDQEFLKKFEPVDILYSWGVLHHTGHLYQALDNVANLVKKEGTLFISIYNDQGAASQRWTWIKKTYTHGGPFLRFFLVLYTFLRTWTLTMVRDTLHSLNPLRSWISYGHNNRGMSAWHDLIDWVGGYPFEVAKPEDIFQFLKPKNFQLQALKTCAGGLGCNEFVFQKL